MIGNVASRINTYFSNLSFDLWESLLNNTVRSDWMTMDVRYGIMFICFVFGIVILRRAVKKDLTRTADKKESPDFKNFRTGVFRYIAVAACMTVIVFLQTY